MVRVVRDFATSRSTWEYVEAFVTSMLLVLSVIGAIVLFSYIGLYLGDY